MKCNNCSTPIPPAFTKALQENTCPACGGQIMPTILFDEFNSIKEKIIDAEVDEATLVKVAALIAGKYDLMPKGSKKSVSTQPNLTTKSHKQSKVKDDDIEAELMDEYPHLKELPDDQRKLEIAALRAEAEREFGLTAVDPSTIKASKKKVLDGDLVTLADSMSPPNTPIFGNLDGGTSDPDTMQRMAKLEALKSNPNVNRFRRSDG